MNAFIEISDTDLVVALAEHAHSLDSKVCGNASAAVAQGKTAQALEEIITNVALFFPDLENLEMLINSVIRSLRAVKPEERASLTKLLAGKLADVSAESKTSQSLRFLSLVGLFNGLDKGDKTRLDVFEKVLTFAGQTGYLDTVSGQLSNISAWIKEWQLDLTQTRALYRLVYKTLVASPSASASAGAASSAAASASAASSTSKLGFDFLTRLVATYPASAPDFASSRPEAEELVTLALALESVFDVFSVLSLDAVKALKAEPLVKLLEIVHAGDLDAFNQAAPSLADTFASRGLVQEKILRKVRLMSLAKLFASKSTLPFAEVASALKVDQVAVENWVIDGIRVGLVEAKVDELNQEVVVTRTTYTEFTRQHWEELETRLVEWKKNIAEVQRTLEQVKVQVQRTLQSASLSR